MNRRSWPIGAMIIVAQVLVLSVLTSLALRFPGAGALSFIVAMTAVCYAGVRLPLAVATTVALTDALMLAFFAQSTVLPTALVFLLAIGIIPYVTQLSHGLSRLALAALVAGGCLLLSFASWGSSVTPIGSFAAFFLCAVAAGWACATALVRKSALGHA